MALQESWFLQTYLEVLLLHGHMTNRELFLVIQNALLVLTLVKLSQEVNIFFDSHETLLA